MTAESEAKSKGGATAKGRKRKQFLPHNRPVKKKGSYPLRPGVEGFFITCDGGRERQASHEAINVIDSFYEELMSGKDTCEKQGVPSKEPQNKKIVFSSSDSSSSDEADDRDEVKLPEGATEKEHKPDAPTINGAEHDNGTDSSKNGQASPEKQAVENANGSKDVKTHDNPKSEIVEPPVKKQCLETGVANTHHGRVEEKSIDKLIEAELEELGDKSKRRFFSLDTGCNGVIFIQMRRKSGDPSPKDIVQHMMTSAAATRKHMSRFILRVLPVEVACYSSEEEISRAIQPLVSQYFPPDAQDPSKFAVMYDARANSGIDRMKIIDAVAKSVPGPHKVDLKNPQKTIVVEIVKTVCLIGVIEKYKELAKYNLRQLTSAKP